MRSSFTRFHLFAMVVLFAASLTGCPDPDADGDLVRVSEGDCDDNNAGIFPGAVDAFCDGIDQDCDGIDPTDGDGDGVDGCPDADPRDCDDEDPNVFPGNTESCNGADDDCDGVIDNGLPSFDWWVDGDADTYGAGTVTTTCGDEPPTTDHVSADLPAEEDCDDEDASVNPGATEICDGVDQDCDTVVDNGLGDNEYWPDGDSDGVGDEAGAVTTCNDTPPTGHVTPTPGTSDCDDADADNYPGNTETCDGDDQDCDAVVDNGFNSDADPVTTCGPDGDPATAADNDCDDLDANNYPGNIEVCDGSDNNCDAVVDENNDGDGDGFTVCGADGLPNTGDEDCNDGSASSFPGATEICDALDNDCDSVVPANETDDDSDDYIECIVPGSVTLPGTLIDGDDCDDGNALINPGATEVCSGADDNCDGVLFLGAGGETELDADGDLYLECPGAGAAFVDVGIGLTGGDDCDDDASTGAGINPGEAEVCDGDDENCNSLFDESFDVDGDTYFDGTDAGCIATYTELDCDDSDATLNPGAPEICDTIDNDCDTLVDADDTADFTGPDADGDNDAAIACGGLDCDDTDPAVHGLDSEGDGESICDGDCDDTSPLFNTSHVEFCDGEDNDCNGAADDGVVADGDGDGFDAAGCGFAGTDCNDGDQHVFPSETYTSGWQRECAPAVSPGFFGSWATGRLNLPSYFEDPQTGTQYLYFRGHHNSTFHQFGYSSRLAGVTQWSAIQGPIFGENPIDPSWDGRRISHPSVVYVPGKVNGYVMAYHGQEDASVGGSRRIGIATANLPTGHDSDADGVADLPFQRADMGGAALVSAVIEAGAAGELDDEQVIHPALWYDNASQLLHMYYTGRSDHGPSSASNEFVLLHASCDTVATDCGDGDWTKTDTAAPGTPDIFYEAPTGTWDSEDARQAFVMTHSDSAGFFGYDLEIWYTGEETQIGYLQGDIADATSWSAYPSPVLLPVPVAGTSRFDSESVSGRGVRWTGTVYEMYYGTAVTLPEDGLGEGTDPLWGVGNYSDGASYIGKATNTPPSLTGVTVTCAASVDGTVTDHAPDTVELEVYDGSTLVAGPVTGTNTGNSNITVQSTPFTVPVSLAAGAHTITVVATDAGGVERSTEVTVTCP